MLPTHEHNWKELPSGHGCPKYPIPNNARLTEFNIDKIANELKRQLRSIIYSSNLGFYDVGEMTYILNVDDEVKYNFKLELIIGKQEHG